MKILDLLRKTSELTDIKVYLVGGFLRDIEINKKPLDVDVVVSFSIDRFINAFSDVAGLKPVKMGEERESLYRFFFPDGVRVDVSVIKGRDIEEDLKNRDFTINSLAMEVSEMKFIDVVGAKEDIKMHLVRANSRDVFLSDPLRILRAYRFAAELGFTIEERTRKWLREEGRRLKWVSKERIRDEFFKLLNTSRSGIYVAKMCTDHVLKHIFPIVKYMDGIEQGDYHHLDVLGHSLMCLRILEDQIDRLPDLFADSRVVEYLWGKNPSGRSRLQLLKFAALFHDVGKPFTKKVVDNKVHFYGHQVVGADVVHNMAIRLKLSREEVAFLHKLVYWHMFPIFLLKVDRKEEDYRLHLPRFLLRVGEDVIALLLLSYADILSSNGRISSPGDPDRLLKIANNVMEYYFQNVAVAAEKPILGGFEIMHILNIEPGPMVGKIKQELLELKLNGIIRHKQDAIEWLNKKYKEGEKNAV